MKKPISFLLAFLMSSLFAGHAFGQMAGSGSVSGTVADPANAAVAGATVALTDTATGAARTSVTNESGRFFMANVLPGTYDVTVTKTGFRVAKLAKQVVSVGTDLTLNVTLEIGAMTQSVEVTASNTELQTMNATIGNTVNSSTLESLPSLGRDVSSFVTMQPGVSPDGSVGGTVVDQANFMLDGGNNSNDMDGSGGVYNPSFGDDPSGGLFSNVNNAISGANAGINGNQPSGVMPTPIDSVEEFKVATSNQTADFNNSSGMQVSIVTKRGTNAWHGTAYEYYLDNNFSGNTWDNNAAGTPRPDWHRSWFGVAGGGPLIPKDIWGGKTYIFMNYQGARFPFKQTLNRLVPSADMRNGFLTDPSLANQTGCDANGRCNLKLMDPRGIGINPLVQQMWNQHMPLPNSPASNPCGPFTNDTICDGVNTLDYRANVAIPQNDNFGVVRLDHDFGQKWHFMSSMRYYELSRATTDQVDIGGFFPGDQLGVPASLTNRPQKPWYLVLGMTTSISSTLTNDFRYSFLRNYWQWGSSGDPAQFSNLGAAIEPFGESSTESLVPYNVNTQNTRTRFWDGKDHFFRDDISWVKGTHLFQFGGQYQHNWNYHLRTDNGGGINFFPVYQLGSTSNAGNVDMTGLNPAFSNPLLARDAAAMLGIVTETQQAFTRTGSNLTLNGPLVPAFDQSTIPYYNLYAGDSWHLKPSVTLTYGLGWTLEMPPVEATGKQVVLVDANGKPIVTEDYLSARKAAALQGNVYNPEIGFALLPNVAGHPKYPYNPFYGGVSPRVSVAWNPDLGPALGGKSTVIRGGYGRIYGRINGVDIVLGPLLSPGLIQPVSCTTVAAVNPAVPGSGGTCSVPAGGLNVSNAFRIGTDGTSAPIPAASATLPQPYFPGFNGIEGSTAAPLDPNLRPNSVDSFDFTIQHQFTPKISVEVGYIGRLIHNELQNINLQSVPYMMTKGGQQFQTAYANIEKAMGCATSETACFNATMTKASIIAALQPQAFFENALSGTGYCTGFASCTAAVVTKEFANFQGQNVWSLWSDLDQGDATCAPGVPCGFNFPFSMLNSGPNAQMSSNVTASTSLGHGNYNAGFVTVKLNNWHGVTLQDNFTYSKALGTGAVIQATSEETATDPFNLNTQYGPQAFDRKFVDTLFLVYEVPYYGSQKGLLGHALGGWSFSPIFTAGSGAPDFCITNGGNLGGEGYSGSQEFGGGDGLFAFTNSNCVFTSRAGTSASAHYINGVPFMFANPSAVFNNVRPLILGLDGNSGGFGTIRGLPYWNMNLGVKKNIRVTERLSAEASFNFINVLNHNQLLDPSLSIVGTPATIGPAFGQLSTEGTLPRTVEGGIRVRF